MVVAFGDLERGAALRAQARQAAERFGAVAALRWLDGSQAFQDYAEGRWDAALERVERLLAEIEAGPPHFTEGPCRQLRGSLRLARGDLPGALADTRHAVEFAVRRDEPEMLQPALAVHAHALLAARRVEEAGARADELLASLAGHGAALAGPDWPVALAIVLLGLGRAGKLVELAATVSTPTPWLRAAVELAAGNFEQAADRYAELRSLPDEAYARLRAAEQLLAAGRRAEATAQLQRALAFYREVRATAYLREGEALLAASA